LAEYARISGELKPDYSITVDLDGRLQRKFAMTGANALLADNSFAVTDSMLKSGRNAITITRTGGGPVYYSAYLRYFSHEDPIPAAGSDLRVARRYFRLIPGTASGLLEP